MPDKHNKQGVAIITVLCYMMVLAVLGAVFARAVGSFVLVTSDQINLESALYIAEAGTERAASYIANGGAVPFSFTGSLGDGSYYVTISAKANAGENSETSVNGVVNINPNNRTDYEFSLATVSRGIITRDDLTSDFGGYAGSATSVRFKPKGDGNQNSLTIDGAPYPVQNGRNYLITADDMSVSLYNDKVNAQGKALGKWYIIITASNATVTDSGD